MRYTLVLISIFIFILVSGCINQVDREADFETQDVILEIESLAQSGIDIPEKITPEDIKKCELAVDMARSIEDQVIELKSLIRLMELHGKAENYREALKISEATLVLANQIKDDPSLALIYKLIGKNYYHLASFNKSFENLEIALKMYQELNDTINIQDVMNFQGNIYFSYHDFDMAYSYYEQNLNISKVRNDNASISKALANIGLIYSIRSVDSTINRDSSNILIQKSIEFINSALQFNRKTNNSQVTAEILYNLADVYRIAGQYDKAINVIKEALALSDGLSDRVYIWSTISYANILFELDSIVEAEVLLVNALQLAKENDLKESIINIYSLLSKIYQIQGDYKLAYENYTNYSYLTQSVFTIGHKKQIDAIKIASDLEAADKQRSQDEQNTYYQTLILFFLLLSVILIVTLFYSRVKQRNKNVNIENNLLGERLETRNRELTTRIMALIQRNEVEKELIQKLNSLKLKLKRENQKEVSDIIRSLSFKQNDQLWKEFEIRFESIHKEFFTKLTKYCPELTTNEKRLCAFLYLDMSSKDISAITGQSIRALNVARTRLRKRFNLTNDTQSLSGFLNSL